MANLLNLGDELKKLFSKAGSFIQQNPTPAGFLAKQLPQQIRTPIENNLGRLRNVDIASTVAGGAMKAYNDTSQMSPFSPQRIVAQNFPIVGAVRNMVSQKPTFASEQIQRAIPGKVGALLGLGAEIALPGIGGEIKAFKGVKGFAKSVAKQAPRAILAGAGEAKNLSQIPQYAGTNLALTAGFSAISPIVSRLQPNAKGFDWGRNNTSKWHPEDVNELDGVTDFIKRNRNLNSDQIKEADTIVTSLARGYLPKAKIEKLASDYGRNSTGFLKAVVNELHGSLKKQEGMGQIRMGIQGEQPLRKSRPGSYTNVSEIDNPLVKGKGFESEMDALAASRKVDIENIKSKKVVLQEKAIKVPSDQAIKDTASLVGGGAGKPANDVQDAFANWVNSRKASKIEGIVKGREFADLNDKGMQGIFDFQIGDKPGNRLGYDPRFRELKKYFDNKYKVLKETGVDLNYRKDYLPQLWKNTPEEVDQTFRRLGLKPSFTIEAVFKNYQEGISAGLTPKFNNIGDLTTWYEARANKAIADRKFFEFMGGQGMVLPRKEAPSDWVTLDPDRFPKITMKTDTGLFTGEYKAPKGIAEMINNYLGGNEDQGIAKVANLFSNIKNRVLSAGIPFTGWNAHGHNILVRNTLANKNPIAGFIKGAYWLTRPQAAENFINTNLKDAATATKYGMKFDVEDHVFKRLEEGPTSIFGQLDKVRSDKYAKWFEDPLFQKALPAMKLSYFRQIFDDFKKNMPEEIAGKRAANVANDMFGGINWEQWGRNRNAQNLFRSIILAPDWLETSLRIGKGVLDAKNPAGKAYRRFAANFTLAFIGANLLNKHLSGNNLWENEPGNEFNLDTGTYTSDGKKRYVRVFGTATDMIRIPLEVAAGIAKGDPTKAFQSIRNRLSIPLSTTMNLVQNQNYLGQPLYGKDKYGNELTPAQSVGGIVGELTPLIAPTQIRAFIDLVSGRNNTEQAVSQALELPIRYKGVFLSPSDKRLEAVGKNEGLKGKSLNEFQKKIKEEKSAFGEKQVQKAEMGGTQYIDSVIQQRQQDRKIKEYKEALKNEEKEKADGLFKNLFTPDAKAGAAELKTKPLTTNEQESKLIKETQEELAKAKVEVQGGTQETEDKIFFQNENGNVTSVLKDRPLEKPILTGQKELDAKAIAQYKSDISSKANDIYTMYKIGKLTQDEANTKLSDLKELKSSGSGGRTLKNITFKKITPKTIKFSMPKRTKVQTIKIKKPPKPKTLKLKGSKAVKVVRLKPIQAKKLKGLEAGTRLV